MLIFAWLSRRLRRTGGTMARAAPRFARVPALLAPGAVLVAAALLASGVPGPATAHAGDIVIASEGARPPYNYFDGDRLAGFEIDLGRDLCRRMDARCTFVAQQWDGMIAGLIAHRYDAIMAAMEITDERKDKIAFSLPYVRMPSAFMVKRNSGLTSDDPRALAGKRIGVEKSGTHEAFLLERYQDSTVRRYSSLSDAILDLEADRVDAVIGDKDAIATFLATRSDARCCHILADVPRDAAVFGDGIGIGLRKDDVALKADFEKALAACVADGTFAAISAKYFSFPIN